MKLGVSIPFKRDGVSERTAGEDIVGIITKFLFPSNGTAFLNQMVADDINQRELFLFPSTGTAFLNELAEAAFDEFHSEFLFPSTGKAFLNLTPS